jgi:hypothetical protein
VRIAARFNGPVGTGNGGFSAGLIASAFPEFAVAEVTLRRPPPLDTPLVRRDDGVYDADQLVATVLPAEPIDRVVVRTPPGDPSGYPGFADHPFPTCYVCGPDRPAGDGLRIFPAPVGDRRNAAAWTVPDGVDACTVWAALDCPGGWSIISPGRPYVLGRFAVSIMALPLPGEQCVVVGECAQTQGRKALTFSSLYGPDGDLRATARGTWIAI